MKGSPDCLAGKKPPQCLPNWGEFWILRGMSSPYIGSEGSKESEEPNTLGVSTLMSPPHQYVKLLDFPSQCPDHYTCLHSAFSHLELSDSKSGAWFLAFSAFSLWELKTACYAAKEVPSIFQFPIC